MYKKVLQGLKDELHDYAEFVKEMLENAIIGIKEKDEEKVNRIIKKMEPKADRKEKKLEEHVIEIIAQYEPRASDLREVVMILKMADNFERMADHAENIAKVILLMQGRNCCERNENLEKMAGVAQDMMIKAVKAYKSMDLDMAKEVLESDDEIDRLQSVIREEVINNMKCDNDNLDCHMYYIRLSDNIERIGDLTENIAEELVYILEGKVV
ncbi:MAG: phosphate signaling complex protein PhoU [Candidatus Muiribacteriaceae bacterium]